MFDRFKSFAIRVFRSSKMDCKHCSGKGIVEDTGIPYGSFGKILYEKLKVTTSDGFAYIDVNTEKSVTFKQVLEKSTKLAVYLKKRGLKRNDVVAVITENSPYFVVPYLSCLYNGYIVNPIDTQFKIGEMKHCMDLTKPRVIFASKTVLEMLTSINAPYVDDIFVLGSEAADGFQCLEDILAPVEDVKDFEPEELDEANQIGAYLYSSGTTGLPKAVVLSHINLRNLLVFFRFVKLKPNETTIFAIPSTHIYGLLLITGYLYHSATLVGFDKFHLDMYLKVIEKYNAPKLFLVPAIVLYILKHPTVRSSMLKSVEQVFCGTATLSQEMIEELEQRFELNLIQLYGLTETSGPITLNLERRANSVGKAFGGCRFKVVGSMGEELPRSAMGEIAVKGEVVTWGYTQKEKNSFDYQGYFLTGDFGCLDVDGFVYISGRNKDVFKCKGYQVAPAEVEGVILQHPAVVEVTVIGVDHEMYGEVAAAFVRILPGSSVSSEEIVQFVTDRLSPTKHLHGGAIFVDEFPKTASGKVLRSKLKDIYYTTVKDL